MPSEASTRQTGSRQARRCFFRSRQNKRWFDSYGGCLDLFLDTSRSRSSSLTCISCITWALWPQVGGFVGCGSPEHLLRAVRQKFDSTAGPKALHVLLVSICSFHNISRKQGNTIHFLLRSEPKDASYPGCHDRRQDWGWS